MYLYQDLNRHPSTIDGYRMAIVDYLGLTLKTAFLLNLASDKCRNKIHPCFDYHCRLTIEDRTLSSTGLEVLLGSSQRPERVSIPTLYFHQERIYLRHQTCYSFFLAKTNYPTLLQTSRPTVLGLGPS